MIDHDETSKRRASLGAASTTVRSPRRAVSDRMFGADPRPTRERAPENSLGRGEPQDPGHLARNRTCDLIVTLDGPIGCLLREDVVLQPGTLRDGYAVLDELNSERVIGLARGVIDNRSSRLPKSELIDRA